MRSVTPLSGRMGQRGLQRRLARAMHRLPLLYVPTRKTNRVTVTYDNRLYS